MFARFMKRTREAIPAGRVMPRLSASRSHRPAESSPSAPGGTRPPSGNFPTRPGGTRGRGLPVAVLLLALVALVALPDQAAAQSRVAEDWSLIPSGLAGGDSFRLIFISSTSRDGASTDIADYNTFIAGRAAAGHTAIQSYADQFKVVGCTADTDARDNTATTYTSTDKGVPIYWLDGSKVADDYEDFYDGIWDNESNSHDRDESGSNTVNTTSIPSWPITGCDHDGTESLQHENSVALGLALGIRQGRPGTSGANNGPLSSDSLTNQFNQRPMYGLSPVFTVANAENDATLSGLALEDGTGNGITLDPAFAPGTTSYTAAVVNRIDTVTLTATKNEDDATVAITDDDDTATPGEAEFTLGEGENIIEVVVTAEDGITTSTYTITATRATLPPAPTDCPSDTDWCATLRVGYTAGDTFFSLASYGYDYATNLGDLSSNTFSYNGLVYEATGLFRKEIRGGDIVLSDLLSLWLDKVLPDGTVLQVGSQTFTVGADSDKSDVGLEQWDLLADPPPAWTGGENVTVSLKIPPPISTDATLSALALEDGDGNGITLDPVFATGTTSYTVAVVNGVDTVTVKPTVNESHATVAYFDGADVAIADADSVKDDQQVDLVVGANTIKVKVTAQDTTTIETYTVTVTRASSTTAPTVSIEAVAPSVTYRDGGSHVRFTVTRTGATDAALDVTVNLTQNRAFLPEDELEKTVTIAAGAATETLRISSNSIDIPLSDPLKSGTLTATVADGTDYDVGTPNSASVDVLVFLTIRLDMASYTVDEGAGTLTVKVIAQAGAGAPTGNHPFVLQTLGETAESDQDYTALNHEGTFVAGDFTLQGTAYGAEATVSVEILDDELDEPAEVFNLIFDRGLGSDYRTYVVNSDFTRPEQGNPVSPVTIVDDDLPVLSALALEDGDGNGITLDPVFAPGTTSYTASPAYDVAAVTITATPADDASSVAFSPADSDTVADGHQVALGEEGETTTLTAVVTAADSTTGTYMVAVNRQPVGICGRTQAVQTAILGKISGISACAAVTTAHLAAITGTLDLGFQSIAALAAGDFAGLTSLEEELLLDNNALTSLAANTFAGLTSLTTLNLGVNALTSLDENAFAGLTSLTDLDLSYNDLTSLAANTFAGLTALETLGLYNNDLTSLDENAFAGLTSLTDLNLNKNALTSLPANAFEGLTALEQLNVRDNDLTSLDANVFTGLTALTNLDLRQNELSELPAGVFAEPTSLTYLGLSYNELSALPAGVFDQLTKLELLNLRDNQLSALPAGVFEKLTELTELTLVNNPGPDNDTNTDDIVPTAMAAANPATLPTSGGEVALDAAGSGGAWGANVTYGWALTRPTGVTVTYAPDAASAMTTATVPGSLTDGRTLTFTLTVTGRGGTYIDTATADVGVAELVDNWHVGAAYSGLSFSANDRGQRFETGDNPTGYVLTSIDIDMTVGFDSGELTVSLWSANSSNLPDTVLATFVNPGNLSTPGTKTFTAPADTHLDVTTQYIITFEYTSGGSPQINSRNTTSVSSSSASGWRLGRFVFKSSGGTWQEAILDRAIRIRIFGNPSDPASNDATLSGLALEDGTGNGITLDPVFAPGTTSYTAAVVNRIDTVTLTATKNEDDATVAITDDDDAATPGEAEFSLVEGENIIEVVVTAEDGITTSTYTITATRATLPPAPSDCPSDTDWCATLRVGYTATDAFISLASYGYDYATNLGDLSSNTFSYNGLVYEAIGLFRIEITGGGNVLSDLLSLWLDRVLPDGTVLQVGNQTFTVGADSDKSDVGLEQWDLLADPPPAWTGGENVTVSLKIPPPNNAPTTLVDNWDVGADSSDLSVSANDRGQRFRTGDNPTGYVLTSIDIDMTSGLTSGDFTVSLWSANNLNLPDTVLATFNNPGNLSTAGTKNFTAPADTHLANDTRYIITFEYTSGATPHINTRNTTSVSSSSASGWSLDRYVLKSGGDWEVASQVQAIRIRIFGNLSNNAPVFANASETRSFDETIGDAAVSTASDIGAVVTATDPDSDTLTYTLEGADSSKFTIDSATGQIKTEVGEKYSYEDETSYEVTVKADDSNGGTDTVDVTLNVLDQDEAPVAPAAPSVSATSGSTTSLDVSWIAPVNTGRPAITNYDLRYRQGNSGGWTNGPQDETGTSASIGSLTAGASYQVQVRATNNEGDSPWSTAGSGSTGNPSNNAPVFANASETRSFNETFVDEAVLTTTHIGAVVTATDADSDTLTYTLEGADSSKFTIVSASGQIKTKVGETYSYEDETSYEVTVKADDGNGGTDTVDVTLNVLDLFEAPAAPAAPSVSATSGSTTSLDVSWIAPVNTGRPAITSYDLRYRQGTSGSWTNGPQDQTGTSASIGSLTADASYQVQVRATNDEGNGGWSGSGSGSTGNLSNNAALSGLALADGDGNAIALAPAFRSSTISYTAGAAHDVAAVTITATPADDTASVAFSPADSDTADGHQVALGAEGETTTLTAVVTAQDTTTIETYTVTVTRASSTTAPTVSIEAVAPSVTYRDGGSHVRFTVTRTGATDAALDVTVNLTQNRAFLPDDELEKTVTLAAGAATETLRISSFSIDIPLSEPLGSGTVTATVAAGTGYDVGTPNTASVDVLVFLTIRLEMASYTVDEGAGTLMVKVIAQADAGAPTGNHSFSLNTDGITAQFGQDYTSLSHFGTFLAGDFTLQGTAHRAEKTVSVTILDDALDEPDEVFNLQLALVASSDYRTYVVNSDFTRPEQVNPVSPVTIVDDDLPVLSVSPATALEGEALEFAVTLSAASADAVTVAYAATGVTATAGTDFTAPGSGATLTIPAGDTTATITIETLADTVDEDAETLTLTLSAPQNATLGTATATGTIDEMVVDVGTVSHLLIEPDPNSNSALTVKWRSVYLISQEGVVSERITDYDIQYAEELSGWPYRVDGEDWLTVTYPRWVNRMTWQGWSGTIEPFETPSFHYRARLEGLTPGTAYRIRIRARTAEGPGPWSWVRPGVPGGAQATALEPLTVALEDLPESHDGSDAFTVRLAFSDEVALDAAGLRAALLVSNGSVTGVSSVSADLWDITITPAGNANVQLLLSPTSDCEATGAICTDDGRMLSAGLGASVPFVSQTSQQQTVAPLTASFSAAPAEHDGSSRFTVRLAFSEEVKAGIQKVKAALTVTGGTVKKARRVAPPSNEQWTITIQPDGHGAVTIILPITEDCDAQGAICTEDGRMLSHRLELTVSGP